VAAQVHRKFKFQVHFSPSSTTKEFFLVAHFHYSSFPLSEEAVGVALECCLGGSAAGFRVIRLSERRFRFSVASNKVGHFLYFLRERCWPDFHCSFSLFRGDGFASCYAPKVKDASPGMNSLWSSHGSLSKTSHSSSNGFSHNLAISPKLDFLKSNAFDGSSSKELAKFNLGQKISFASPMEVSPSVHVSRDLYSSPPMVPPTSKTLRVGDIDCFFWTLKFLRTRIFQIF
jgi:hypothetical protein